MTMKTNSTARRFLTCVALSIALGGIAYTAQATLLVYEPFEFTPGQNLEGLSGGAHAIGMIGQWTATCNGTASAPYPGTNGFQIITNGTPYGAGPFWKGYVTSLPQNGHYAGSPANHSSSQTGNEPNVMWASRPLDPNIVTNFTLGATNWMSYVAAHNFSANNNYIGCEFIIGQGTFIGTGSSADPAGSKVNSVFGGQAVGVGLTAYSAWGAAPKGITAGMWDTVQADGYYVNNNATAGASGEGIRNPASTNGPPIIIIARIIWGDLSNPTTVAMTYFTNGAVINEAAFNSGGSSNILHSTTGLVDPTTFTNISLGGGRFNVDELRIGTTFSDVIGLVPATYGNYWAPGTNGGGTGDWAAGVNSWASIPSIQGANSQSPGSTLIFAGAPGTITVNGTITVGDGLLFSTDGYSLVPGSSAPQISLSGANAAANAITVTTGSITNGVQVTGNAGMTIKGPGTFVLGNASNTYGGGTVLSGGILQIAALGSLGSGNVDFQGGVLQYSTGAGASAVDVSSRIPTVAVSQLAKIDTGGNDVIFRAVIGGGGGLTKLGSGSLTLAAVNTYTGPTTVSAGTLYISGASGVITTLNVPDGGTVNLGAGAMVTALNITGGAVNLVGAGVQVGTLFASGGTLTNRFGTALAITNSANLKGVSFNLVGGSFFTLDGADLLNPTSSSPRVVTATGGTLSVMGTGLDAALGISAPGLPAVAAKTTFHGNQAWTLVNGMATDLNNTYGRDSHTFHYLALPTGDFDIKVRLTGATNAAAGLMVRDSLVARVGNSAGIWTTLGDAASYPFTQYPISSTVINGTFSMQSSSLGVLTPWLGLKKIGHVVGMYYSEDGINYMAAQEVDYSSQPWGPTLYLGLDLVNTSLAGGSAAFDEVNFLGTNGVVDISTTKLSLSGSAQVNLGPVMYVKEVSANGVALANGCWASSAIAGANHLDHTVFTSTGSGVAVIGTSLTVTVPDVTVTTSDLGAGVAVTYPAPVIVGGTPPYSTNYVPDSNNLFPVGTSTVTCMVTDSSCPFAQTRYGSFRVTVGPPAPVMNPAVDANTGFARLGGVPTFNFGSVAGFRYRVVYTGDLATPLSAWLPVVSGVTDSNGWVVAAGAYTTLDDPNATGAIRFYRIQATGPN